MLAFGSLKFVDPFKSWYATQIDQSGLGELSYVMGIAGEIGVGLAVLLALTLGGKWLPQRRLLLISGASVGVVVMMSVGIWVHLQPAVPAEVLPMKIKPPYIPGFFLALAVANIWLSLRESLRLRP